MLRTEGGGDVMRTPPRWGGAITTDGGGGVKTCPYSTEADPHVSFHPLDSRGSSGVCTGATEG